MICIVYINNILKICSQRLYLLKLLRDQGIPPQNCVYDSSMQWQLGSHPYEEQMSVLDDLFVYPWNKFCCVCEMQTD